jgi:uncharacterized protein
MRALTASLATARAAAIILVLLALTACGGPDDEVDAPAEPDASSSGPLEVGPDFARFPAAQTQRFGDTLGTGDFKTLDWDALIPEAWQPERLLEGLSVDGVSLDDISDEDPRAETIMEKLTALWKEAPVIAALDGQRVKLPGFVVPLDYEGGEMREFLLVPYYGACIHVPPPPANQIVHVVLPEGETYRGGAFDALWISGTIEVERSSSDVAEAGYRLNALEIAPY